MSFARTRQIATLLLLFAPALASCSMPSLEQPECTASRVVVKRFYSLYFDEGLRTNYEHKNVRESYLTPKLVTDLSLPAEREKDYFTQTHDFPKAFRVGECMVRTGDSAALQVVLLWRDDTRSEQSQVKVNTVRMDDRWLIDAVEKD